MAKLSLTIVDQRLVHRRLLQAGEKLRVCRREVREQGEAKSAEPGFQVFQSASRTVSTNHADFRVEVDGRVVVTDRGSTNGTWLRLEPFQDYTLPADGEVMLGSEITIKRKSPPWESFPEAQNFSDAKEFATHLKTHFKEHIADVKVLRTRSPDLQRTDPACSKFLLSDNQGVLVVQWKRTTTVLPIERWVKDSLLLFNCEQASASTSTEPRESAWSFLATSPNRQRVLHLAQRIAKKHCPLLLIGPTGAGKEVLARDIHDHSLRHNKPFVAVNCAALPETLLESELFGVRAGAFTNAAERRGLFEVAHEGTFFLDEVGEMPLPLQAKLLRVLEEYKVRRVGDTKERDVNVRIIAATNRNLEKMVAEGTFREDLYFRLNALQLDLPILEPSDIAALAVELLQKGAVDEGLELSASELEEISRLAAKRQWPGNARQLRNALKKYLTLRQPDSPPEQNWHDAMDSSASGAPALISGEVAPLPVPSKSEPAAASGPESAAPALAESTPEGLSDCIDCIDTLSFLNLTKEILARQHRGALRAIGDRAGMTGAGASARLRRLKVVNENQEPELALIDAAITAERAKLDRFRPYLRMLLSF